MKKKYKKQDTTPDYVDGIYIKDTELGPEFVKEPVIYGDVDLNDDERAAIRMHPKFKLYGRINSINCEAEIERCLTSIRWGSLRASFADRIKVARWGYI